jgi:Tol biopolymer transport system component
MTARFEFDRRLIDWLEDAGAPQTPAYFEELLEQTRRTPQRRAWASLERWLPVQLSIRQSFVPVRTAAWALLVLVLLLALALVAVGFPAGRHLPPPVGPAANGLIAVDDHAEIRLLGSDGAVVKVLNRPDEAAIDPSWSPDGTRLAFYAFPAAPQSPTCTADAAPLCDGPDRPIGSLLAMNADGSGRIVLARDRQFATRALAAAAWSHDGRRLAFSYRTASGGPAFDVVDGVGTTVAHVDGGDMPTWSPDDSKLAYRVESVGVFIVDLANLSSARRISKASGSGFAFAAPAWSHDGSRLAFYDGADGGHDVMIAVADGSAEWRVGATIADEYWPEFSPDVSRLAFERVVDGNNDINFVVADADGGNPHLLATQPLGGTPRSWSPDGRSLVGFALTEDTSHAQGLLVVDVANPSSSVTIPTVGGSYAWQRLAP